MPDESIDLILTSPPYNIGKEYEQIAPLRNYLARQERRIKEMYRVLKSTGSICWQVGYIHEIPLEYHFYPIFKRLQFQFRNRIIWYSRHGIEAKRHFSRKHEALLWLTKSDNYKFNLDAVRVPPRYPQKRGTKEHNRGQYTCNPLGKNPDDVWHMEWETGVWDFCRVKAGHGEKTAHPCQFPLQLAERCILALTEMGDTVFDPYMGSGTTIVAALKNERKGFGCDTEQKYIDIAKERVFTTYPQSQ